MKVEQGTQVTGNEYTGEEKAEVWDLGLNYLDPFENIRDRNIGFSIPRCYIPGQINPN